MTARTVRNSKNTIQENLKELGSFLQRKRLEAGLSQGDVSKILGYQTPQFISNIERGTASPPMTMLKELIHMYGITPKEITELLITQQRRYYESEFSR